MIVTVWWYCSGYIFISWQQAREAVAGLAVSFSILFIKYSHNYIQPLLCYLTMDRYTKLISRYWDEIHLFIFVKTKYLKHKIRLSPCSIVIMRNSSICIPKCCSFPPHLPWLNSNKVRVQWVFSQPTYIWGLLKFGCNPSHQRHSIFTSIGVFLWLNEQTSQAVLWW